MSKPGLYANIHAKRKRIAKGSGEKMRRPGSEGAPSKKDFEEAARTAKKAEIEYRGHTFPGYNKPIANRGPGKHKKMVLAKKGDKVKLVRFGHKDYRHNYSEKAKKNYLKRSAGIRGKGGRLTKDDKFSANYWARRVLWPSGEKADGSAKKTAAYAAGQLAAIHNLGL